MKKSLRPAALLSAIILALSLVSSALAAPANNELAAAQSLKSLGLFHGNGDAGFELERAPSRMECIIMLIRLMGKETEAFTGEWNHPFSDSPSWQGADQYLGYAYTMGLATGRTSTTFDPYAAATLQECVTLTLRALGYEDGDEGRVIERWEELAKDADISLPDLKGGNFTRGDAVLIYQSALKSKTIENGKKSKPLYENLISEGVFSQEQYDISLQILNGEVDLDSSSLEAIASAVYAGVNKDTSYLRIFSREITDENMAYYIGVDDLAITDGLACEPMISAQAHSACFIRVEDGVDVEKAMTAIKSNVDPRKWICVWVSDEDVMVTSHGNLIMLVMDRTLSQDLVNSFQALAR